MTIQQETQAMPKPIFVFGLRQSCLDIHGIYEVKSIEDIDLNYHWVDRAKYEKDPEAFWQDVVAKSNESTRDCKCKLCNR